jgi:hypothetical protein
VFPDRSSNFPTNTSALRTTVFTAFLINAEHPAIFPADVTAHMPPVRSTELPALGAADRTAFRGAHCCSDRAAYIVEA